MTIRADGVELSITIDKALSERLGKIGTPETMRAMNEAVGNAVLERVKDHLAQMSVSRHKVADRLGATHTGFYENAPGRTVLRDANETGSTVVVQETPGLSRAYHDIDIAPTGGKKWLTIPLSRVSYGKRVADLRTEGHDVFRPGKARILAEKTGQTETYVDKDGKRKKRKRLRPLYALVKSVRIPRDEGLLPTDKQMLGWMTDQVSDFIESAELLGD